MKKTKIKPIVEKIISGGQTGADMGGLLAAKELGMETGGWAPKGWKTEDGSNLELKKFGLKECLSNNYSNRTYLNVNGSDGTIIFGDIRSPGSRLTVRLCRELNKPYTHVSFKCRGPSPIRIINWLHQHQIKVLNVAGNRASKNRKIQSKVNFFLLSVLPILPAIVRTGWKLIEDLDKDACFESKEEFLNLFKESQFYGCPICGELISNEGYAVYHCQDE